MEDFTKVVILAIFTPIVFLFGFIVAWSYRAFEYRHAARSLSMIEANLYDQQAAAIAAAVERARGEWEAQGGGYGDN